MGPKKGEKASFEAIAVNCPGNGTTADSAGEPGVGKPTGKEAKDEKWVVVCLSRFLRRWSKAILGG